MISRSRFRPAWWLPGPHAQTLWPVFARPRPRLELRRERIELPDGDFLDIAWHGDPAGEPVLVLHGLEGSLDSHYAGTLLLALGRAGYQGLFMHFRGCSGEPNRLPRTYHSGDTADLEYLASLIEVRLGRPLSAVIGFSLGGNVLLKWLGEKAGESCLKTAVAVSVPFLLNDCALRLEQGLSRFYRDHLMRRLRRSYKARLQRVPEQIPVDVDRLRGFREFDDAVTAPLNGFVGVDDYYERASSRQYLGRIVTPTLILQSEDDPFMWARTIPGASELAPNVMLELSARGGHVGFVAGRLPWRPRYWLEERILRHLRERLGRASASPH